MARGLHLGADMRLARGDILEIKDQEWSHMGILIMICCRPDLERRYRTDFRNGDRFIVVQGVDRKDYGPYEFHVYQDEQIYELVDLNGIYYHVGEKLLLEWCSLL